MDQKWFSLCLPICRHICHWFFQLCVQLRVEIPVKFENFRTSKTRLISRVNMKSGSLRTLTWHQSKSWQLFFLGNSVLRVYHQGVIPEILFLLSYWRTCKQTNLSNVTNKFILVPHCGTKEPMLDFDAMTSWRQNVRHLGNLTSFPGSSRGRKSTAPGRGCSSRFSQDVWRQHHFGKKLYQMF